ncbi:hypothetical protein OAH76_03770 [Verrucomicrobia bacterium]|nr:hypothetical protein [Verrucomicrobiota bacterium]
MSIRLLVGFHIKDSVVFACLTGSLNGMHAHSGGLRCDLPRFNDHGAQTVLLRRFEAKYCPLIPLHHTYQAFPDSAVRFVIPHFPGAGCIEAIGSAA